MLGFLDGRVGGRKLRGFFAHSSGKQFGPSSGFSECLHQELHPRELVFGVTGHLPDSTALSPRTFWNFARVLVSQLGVFRADQSGMSAIVVVLHPAQRQPAGRPDLAGLVDWGAGSARHRLARGLGDDEAVMERRAIVVLRPDGQRERSVTKPEGGA
jgi:hypothetical protein